MTQEERIKRIIKRNTDLKQVRSNWETLWDDALQFVAPQAGTMLAQQTTTPGEKFGSQCYDGTAIWAANVLVNGLQSGLVPDNYQWFKWSVLPLQLNQVPEVKAWLQECEKIAYLAIGDSNYGEATNAVFGQQVVYGTGCKYFESDPGKVFAAHTLKLNTVTFAENNSGRVDTVFREYKISARNAVRRWGPENLPDVIVRAHESGNHDVMFDFLQAIYPREDYDIGKRDRMNMPFASLHIAVGANKLVDEGGYVAFPFSVPRWVRSPEEGPYGRGPAIQALQDMGVLNQVSKSNLVAAHKMVEPPLAIPEDGFNAPLNLNPGGRNFFLPGRGDIKPIVTSISVPFSIDYRERMATAVSRHFFTDVFLMLTDNPKMTATEVLERKQEKLMILGPTLWRQKMEHLDTDLDIIFAILQESGQLPQPPEILLRYGRDIKTEYVSPLMVAQSRQASDTTMRVYQNAAAISQITQRPDALAVLNDEEAMRLMADRENAPTEIMRSREEVAQARQAAAEQQKALMEQQQMEAMTTAAQKVGSIPVDPQRPNVATAALGMMGA